MRMTVDMMFDGSLVDWTNSWHFALAKFCQKFLLKTGDLIPIYHNCEQPQVSSASVNLTTETAIVWPVSEVKVAPNWQKDVGEVLAKHLTTCGFKSNLRGLHLVSTIN